MEGLATLLLALLFELFVLEEALFAERLIKAEVDKWWWWWWWWTSGCFLARLKLGEIDELLGEADVEDADDDDEEEDMDDGDVVGNAWREAADELTAAVAAAAAAAAIAAMLDCSFEWWGI